MASQVACDQVGAVATWNQLEDSVAIPGAEGAWMIEVPGGPMAPTVQACCEVRPPKMDENHISTYDIACLRPLEYGPYILPRDPIELRRAIDTWFEESPENNDDTLLSDPIHLFLVSGQAFPAPRGEDGFLFQASSAEVVFGAAPVHLPIRVLPRDDGFDAATPSLGPAQATRPKLSLMTAGNVTVTLDDTKRLRRWMAANWTHSPAWRPVGLTRVDSCAEQFPHAANE